ncbi:PfkB family carbohydrate kinase [Paenibacillus sp. LjRoot153]|uniref:PfkB family carbohydrate kinase n=1 Tax=Paenibacillus sp. LjRoot153 TaxID=3342270 RepID=UPI003ECCFB7A
MTAEQDLEKAARKLVEQYRITLLLATAGGAGSFYQMKDWWGKMESFPVRTKDTTGAGDAFFGALLYGVLEKGKALPVVGRRGASVAIALCECSGSSGDDSERCDSVAGYIGGDSRIDARWREGG